MTLKSATKVQVNYVGGESPVQIGRLFLKDRIIFFEYDSSFLSTGLELSPIKLPLKPGIIGCHDRIFEGLFGLFNDSLPDGWGRLLLDRKIMKIHQNPGDLSPLDRLCFVGSHGMGALHYQPEWSEEKPYHNNIDLNLIEEEIIQFQENDDNSYVEYLLSMNGSSAGARPKILVTIDNQEWLIKFRSSLDLKDIGPIEFAYHLMAKDAKLDIPKAKLFPAKKGPGYFGVERFDRKEKRPIHMHTMSGLLHADHRIPSLDYEMILKATLFLTKEYVQGEKQFRATVFNVLAHNRDDHAKNFSFLMNKQGNWIVSPAYDLTFSSGPNGEHCTTLIGEGKNPNRTHLKKLAEIIGMEQKRAEEIIDEVKMVVANWASYAKMAGVGNTSQKMIQSILQKLILNF